MNEENKIIETEKEVIEEISEEVPATDAINNNDETKKKKNIFREFLDFGLCLIIAVISAYLIVNFVAQRTNVDGNSMYPYLHDKESLIVEKLTYKFGDVDRFDIVVFPQYDESRGGEVYYIKRVIGMPGEKIKITGGKIYINGEEFKEDYGYYQNDVPMSGYDAEEEIEIGEDEYFVMGDNRNGSKDSRQIGCIKGDKILGRAFFRVFPFDRFGFLD